MDILNRLESRNSIEDILILIAVEALLWEHILTILKPSFYQKGYNPYKFEILPCRYNFWLLINWVNLNNIKAKLGPLGEKQG